MGRIAPLTAQESAFAAEKHDFIFQYLRKRRLPDDYYDIVVEPYIRAVRVWLARPELHQYGFPSIAGTRMDAALYKHRQREGRLHQLYKVVRLDACVGEFQDMAVADVVADPRKDFAVSIEQREAIREELRKMPAEQAAKLIDFCSASNRRENRQYRKAGEPNPLVACKCGCGATFLRFDEKKGQRRDYLWGHGSRQVDRANPYVLCKCGCGNVQRQFDSQGRRREYIRGHNARKKRGGQDADE